MSAAEAKFFRDANHHRTTLYDAGLEARAQYKGNLNFSAYMQANDRQYLGIVGTGQYYAKPWGNDSSNIQAVLNGPAYWKRTYYRPNIAEDFRKADIEAEMRRHAADVRDAARSGTQMKKSVSEPNIEKLKDPIPDGYAGIKTSMQPFAERQGKPRIRAPQVGEKLGFWNTMENKYHMKAGGKNLSWNVDREGHRSSKAEANWILSNYFRTDTQAVLTGVGREPVIPKD
mmetsp:Transcript_83866/g.234028  ORF Transcript_83866/g.234028 Transcript_83866/m.234028 type:complete len:229 (-) Transcript_83866:127-813(-)